MTYDSAAIARGTIALRYRAGFAHIGRYNAVVVGVKCHLVVGYEIDTFDDVDLAVGRPIISRSPNAGPNLQNMLLEHNQM